MNANPTLETEHFQPFGERTPEKLEAAATRRQDAATEADRFLASAERLFDQQRRRVLELESRYEKERVSLVDGYRVQMRNLEHQAREALRGLDRKHAVAIADARRILDALTGMRG